MADAFVYCWTDKLTNKLYVGYHKGSDLDGYVCSSESMLNAYKIRPEDFSRQIIASGNHKDMVAFEHTILKSFNASQNEGFYNLHNGGGKFTCTGHSLKTRKKISLAKKGKPSPHRGRKHTNEARLRMTAGCVGRVRSEESKSKQSLAVMGEHNHFYGMTHSVESRLMMSESKKISQLGASNSNATAIKYEGIHYGTMGDMSRSTGISAYKIRNMIKSGDVEVVVR